MGRKGRSVKTVASDKWPFEAQGKRVARKEKKKLRQRRRERGGTQRRGLHNRGHRGHGEQKREERAEQGLPRNLFL